MPRSHVTFDSRRHFFKAGAVHRVPKQWGEEQWIVNKEYCGKKLVLRKNRRCSMHMHKDKDEVFYVQTGKVLMELGDQQRTLQAGDFVHVQAGVKHRFTGLEDSEIFEFSTHHREDDSYRTELSGHADPERYGKQSSLLQAFTKQRILVVGDVMLDRYTRGTVERVSPEAPIPVVRAREVFTVLGGAANNAANVAALGGQVHVVGVCGRDEVATELKQAFAEQKIRQSLVSDAKRPTTTKHRVVGNQDQQITRVDWEVTDPLSTAIERQIIASLKRQASRAQAILVADYAKGVMTPKVYAACYAAGRQHKIPVVVDPKPRGPADLALFKAATVITPNVREARCLLADERSQPEALGRALSGQLKGAVVLTRGGEGMDLYQQKKQQAHFDSLSGEVVDVSGAGDTAASTVALCLAAGASLTEATDLANRASAIVVGKHGTATVSAAELDAAL